MPANGGGVAPCHGAGVRPAALERVYRLFERPVYTLALRICGDREAAGDVLQLSLLRVFERAGGFRGGASPFWGWLRQIAVNQALMALRRRDDDTIDGVDRPEPADDTTLPPPLLPPPAPPEVD